MIFAGILTLGIGLLLWSGMRSTLCVDPELWSLDLAVQKELARNAPSGAASPVEEWGTLVLGLILTGAGLFLTA